MPVFLIQELVDRAASIADMHDNFINPADWLNWYNVERRALQLFMAQHGTTMQDLEFTFLVPNAFDDTADDGMYTLFKEVTAVVGVWEVLPNGYYRQLRIVNFVDNNFQNGLGGETGPVAGKSQTVSMEETTAITGGNLQYCIKFRFYPIDRSGNYLIVTAKAPDVAVNLSDSVILPMGLEERIVLALARRALIKEESDVTDVTRLLKETDATIEEYLWRRALAETPSVRNVDKVQRGWMSEFTCPASEFWVWM